jgi:hypothetical protein
VKERELQAWTIDVARRFGWRVYHVAMPVQRQRGGGYAPDPRGAGLPDLFLLHDDPPRMIIAELKGDGGRLTGDQTDFLRLARAVADDCELGTSLHPGQAMGEAKPLGVYVWTPADRDAIETVLRSKVLS